MDLKTDIQMAVFEGGLNEDIILIDKFRSICKYAKEYGNEFIEATGRDYIDMEIAENLSIMIEFPKEKAETRFFVVNNAKKEEVCQMYAEKMILIAYLRLGGLEKAMDLVQKTKKEKTFDVGNGELYRIIPGTINAKIFRIRTNC